MTLSKNFYNYIVLLEGLRLKAYKDSKGIPTIGIGTIRYPNGVAVKMGDVCTEDQAYEYLDNFLQNALKKIIPLLKNIPINQNQFDAIMLLVYNIGVTGFTNSGVLKQLKKNPNDLEKVKEFWMMWNKETKNGVKQVNQGLVNRRKKEYQLYSTPI